MLKKESGITLIVLIIAIIVLLILAGVTIPGAMRGVDEAQENKLWSELEMVQHAVLERETKYKLTKNESLLEGTVVELASLPELPGEKHWKITTTSSEADKKYYRLNGTELENIGLEPGADAITNTYIVNYYTGEVYNETRQVAPSGTALYITLKLNNE